MKTYQEILKTREINKLSLLDYFGKVGINTNALIEENITNGRNNKCAAFTVFCNEAEYKDYSQAFYYSQDGKGGDYFTWSKYAENKYKLSITIKDGWN